MNNIILSATLIVAFFMCVMTYLLGIKHGKQLCKGTIPTMQINPVKRIIQAVEAHENKKEEKELEDELEDIMSYTKESALKAVKKERAS